MNYQIGLENYLAVVTGEHAYQLNAVGVYALLDRLENANQIVNATNPQVLACFTLGPVDTSCYILVHGYAAITKLSRFTVIACADPGLSFIKDDQEFYVANLGELDLHYQHSFSGLTLDEAIAEIEILFDWNKSVL